MRKKITLLFALLCVSLMGWAETEKFVPADASIDHVYFRTYSWAEETTQSTATWSAGVLTVSMTEGKNEQWQAQVFLDTKVTYDASKKYTISFDITTSNGVGNIMVKLGNTGTLYAETTTTGASVLQHYTKENVQGVAGNDGMLIFDFGYAPANTNITISNISIIEKEAAPAEPVSYCDYEIGHLAASNADPNSFILLSVSSDGKGNTTVTIKQDAAKNSQMFDYLQVSGKASTGSDVNEGGQNQMEVSFETPAADGNGDITLEILWSTVNWDGRWMVQNLKVPANATCATPSSDTELPDMSAATVSVDSKTHNTAILAITGATDNEGVTKYVVKNHSDNSSVGEFAPADNKITINGLSPETPYNWDVYAKDAAGNISENSKNVTFTTDALVANYCGETLTNGDNSIALTCEMVSAGNYRIIIEGTNLAGIGGSYYNPGTVALNSKITSSSSTRIVCELDVEPNFYTPLYVNMPSEVSYTWPNNVVWGSCPAVAVTGVSLDKTKLEMQVGGVTQTLIATVTPANATNQNVSWTSDKPGVATVENGVVTAVGEGEAIITVTTEDGSRTATCEVTVTVPEISPATYNGYSTDGNFFVKYAITRNISKQIEVSAAVEWLPSFGGVVPQIWKGGDHINLTNNGGVYTGLFDSEFTDGDELNFYFRFEYSGGATGLSSFSYTVGSEQAAPAPIPAGAVVLNMTSNSLSVGETDNLTATVYPSFATNKTITWSSDDTDVASVENGTVTANAAGTAHITATCGEVSAQYTATVTASLEETKYYGTGAFTNFADSKDAFAYEYCFTRATNHQVTLDVVFSEDMTPYIGENDFRLFVGDQNNKMDYNAATKTATYHFGSQSEGATISCYFYFVMSGGVHQSDQVSYTVGSANEKAYACVVDEDINNSAVLAAYDGRTAQVIIDRSFTADNLYTLVLPFNVDAAQTAEKLPGKLTKLNNTIVKENEDLRLNFVDAVSIEAGVPYLYSPSANITNPVFTGVTISSALRPTAPTGEKAAYYGIYAPTTGEELKTHDAYVLGSDQYLYAASVLQNDQPMKALRGYFVLSFPSGANAPRARVIFNSQETEIATGISDVQSAPVQCTKVIRDGLLLIIRDGRTYDAQGQLIK